MSDDGRDGGDVTTIEDDDASDVSDEAAVGTDGDVATEVEVDEVEVDEASEVEVDEVEVDEASEVEVDEVTEVDDDDDIEEVAQAVHVLAAEPAATDGSGPPEPAPSPSRRQQRQEIKASARRIRRVVRRVDPWSVFKVASIFIACLWGIVVLASLVIWRAAVTSGSVDNTEDFIKDLGFEDFNFDPQQMFESLLSAGAVVAIAAIFFVVLLTVLFNLVCDITGGLRITMIEQDLADPKASTPES